MPSNRQSDAAESNKALQETLDRGEPRIFAAYSLVGAILLCGAIGYGIDAWAGTRPWCVIAGLLIGIAIGFYSLISSVRQS